jgi:ribosomal protein L14E/L6E/L27E
MEIKVSYIVRSRAGRDSGKLFVVVGFPREAYVSLADGKRRKLESPKKKKLKHVSFYSTNETRMGDKLRNDEKVTNAELRRALSELEASNGENHTDLGGDTLGER